MSKVITYFGSNMREAVNQVQEEMGPDAMIVATRRVDDGIEIDVLEKTTQPAPDNRELFNSQSMLLKDMQGELSRLRGMVENRLGTPTWNEQQRQQSPTKTNIFNQLTKAGFSTLLSQSLAEQLPDNLSLSDAWKNITDELKRRLRVPDVDLIDEKGIIALIGPTGVGKTTTIAKLAARYTMKYGPDQIGLITADFYRVAGREQLRIYGRILDIPVHMVNNITDLNHALHRLQDKRLILIDTAGVSQRDEHLTQKLAMITEQENPLKAYVVLAANCQAALLEEAISAYRCPQLAGAIISKIDESPILGHVLGACMQDGVPITHLCSGQNVPEDIHSANIDDLITRALGKVTQASEWNMETASA